MKNLPNSTIEAQIVAAISRADMHAPMRNLGEDSFGLLQPGVKLIYHK